MTNEKSKTKNSKKIPHMKIDVLFIKNSIFISMYWSNMITIAWKSGDTNFYEVSFAI